MNNESEREMLERHLREIDTMYAQFACQSPATERERERIEFRLRQLDAEEAPKTVVENERVSLPVVIDCPTCKHRQKQGEEPPCNECRQYAKWEPHTGYFLDVEDDGREIRCVTLNHDACEVIVSEQGYLHVKADSLITPADARIFALRILKTTDKAEGVPRG